MFDRDTLNTIRRLLDNYPDRIVDVLNSLSENQYSSKDWLIEKLNEYPHHFKYKSLDKKINICLLASWYGLLAYLMIDKFKLKQIANIDCIDFDPKSKSVAKKLWKKIDTDNLKYKSLCFKNFSNIFLSSVHLIMEELTKVFCVILNFKGSFNDCCCQEELLTTVNLSNSLAKKSMLSFISISKSKYKQLPVN